MKTIIKTIAVAFVASTLAFTGVQAKVVDPITPKSFNVGMYNIINSLKMRVLVEKSADKSISVSLVNEKGETLFEESISKKETLYAKNFNLENLEDGKYRFVITDGKEKVVKEVDLSSKTPTPTEFRSIQVQ